MKWTDKQWDAVHFYESEGTYESASKILQIAAQNVEKRCKAANWIQLKHAENTFEKIQNFIEEYHLLEYENSKITLNKVSDKRK
jgi:hypothetical protein